MFIVHPNEIRDFTGDELVELLRRLLYAEARNANAPLNRPLKNPAVRNGFLYPDAGGLDLVQAGAAAL